MPQNERCHPRGRTAVFHDMEVLGVFQGYQGLIKGDFKRLHVRSVAKILGRGGTILKSARCMDFHDLEGRKRAHINLVEANIDGLVVIGGNGTFTGAMKFGRETGFPVVGLPGTIDNDLSGSDSTIGFDTAINTVIDAVDKIRDTAEPQPVVLRGGDGRDSGFIALKSGIATGAVAVMTPEMGMSIDDLVAVLHAGEQSNKTSSIVIVAEGDPNGGATKSRSASRKTDTYETRITVLGHLQRGGSPSCFDRVLASRLGVAAVEALRQGHNDVMAGVIDDKIELTPFEIAISTKSRINEDEVRIARILSI